MRHISLHQLLPSPTDTVGKTCTNPIFIKGRRRRIPCSIGTFHAKESLVDAILCNAPFMTSYLLIQRFGSSTASTPQPSWRMEHKRRQVTLKIVVIIRYQVVCGEGSEANRMAQYQPALTVICLSLSWIGMQFKRIIILNQLAHQPRHFQRVRSSSTEVRVPGLHCPSLVVKRKMGSVPVVYLGYTRT